MVPTSGITTAPENSRCRCLRRHHEHRAVNESPTQLGDPCLPLLLALFFGRAELGASVSRGGRRGVRGRLNPERTHQQHGEIVGAAHRSRPAGRRGIEQEAIRGPGRIRKRAHEAFPVLRGRQESSARAIASAADGAASTVPVYEARPSVMSRARSLSTLSGISHVTSLSEGQRVANGLGTQLS